MTRIAMLADLLSSVKLILLVLTISFILSFFLFTRNAICSPWETGNTTETKPENSALHNLLQSLNLELDLCNYAIDETSALLHSSIILSTMDAKYIKNLMDNLHSFSLETTLSFISAKNIISCQYYYDPLQAPCPYRIYPCALYQYVRRIDIYKKFFVKLERLIANAKAKQICTDEISRCNHITKIMSDIINAELLTTQYVHGACFSRNN